MVIKHILVPIDFSPCAINALKAAVKMAKKWEGKIFLSHALQVPESYMTIAGTYTPVDYQSIHEEVNISFRKLEEEVPELNFVAHETLEFSNDLIEGLMSAIQSKQIDFIVMGTKSSHDKLERVLGTHSAEVIESSNIPVLMIPESSNLTEMNKIGFATDGRSISNTSRIAYLAELAAFTGASVEVFFIGKPGENIDFEFSENKQILERHLGSVVHNYRSVVNENLLEGITSYVDNYQIDLLAVIPRHHDFLYKWFHGSTTKYVAQNLHMPMLALPE